MPFTDEEWAEIEEELPGAHDDVLEKYRHGRDGLIAEENRQRSDHSFRTSLSPIARRAELIVSRIRAEEQRTIWTGSLEEDIAQSSAGRNITVHPGMMFSLAKQRMESTKLWRIVRRMPKGALLHAHLDAMVEFDFVIDLVMRTPGLCLSVEERPMGANSLLIGAKNLATEERRRDAVFAIRFKKSWPEYDSERTIWTEGYPSGTPQPLEKVAEDFPTGGRAGFVKWLYSRCTISQTDSMEAHHGVDAIWDKFKKCFLVVGSMLHYEPVFRQFFRRLLSLLVADGVQYVELRSNLLLNFSKEGSDVCEPDNNLMFEIMEDEVKKFKATEEGKKFWGIRVIWTALRFLPTRSIIEDMDACITAKLTFPDLIAGYDLVGQEDDGRPLSDLTRELFWFKAQCASEGVEIPLLLHAGETLGTGSDTDKNLFDAVMLGARRIGHGFSLYKHPLLCDLVRDRRILVESCPISNEVLRLCGSVISHPLPALLARGVPCCLNNDDPAMLGQDTAGMTHDFWQTLQGWESLGLAGLGSLAENSVRWAVFEDESSQKWHESVRLASLGHGIKAERLQEWAVSWEEFCLWVTTEYGEYLDDKQTATLAAGEGSTS